MNNLIILWCIEWNSNYPLTSDMSPYLSLRHLVVSAQATHFCIFIFFLLFFLSFLESRKSFPFYRLALNPWTVVATSAGRDQVRLKITKCTQFEIWKENVKCFDWLGLPSMNGWSRSEKFGERALVPTHPPPHRLDQPERLALNLDIF